MAQFKPKEVLSSNLDTTKVVTGQMILISDIGDLYFDSAASGRIHVSGIIPINVNEYYSNYSDDCRKWIEFLQRRNDLVHEYYNYEFMADELKTALLNYSDCVQELVDSLYENAKQQGILSFAIRKDK